MEKNRRESVATNEIEKKELLKKIIELFSLKENEFYVNENGVFFDYNFKYKDILIHIYTNIDNMRTPYQDIEIKRESIDYEYSWTTFGILLAFNKETAFNMNINYNYLYECIVMLKEFIDKGKVFFEYYNKDYSKRYFIINNIIKQLPLEINLDEETKLRFGTYADRIEKYKAFL